MNLKNITLEFPNPTTLSKNYIKELNYGGLKININGNIDIIKDIRVGNKIEILLKLPFAKEVEEQSVKSRICLISVENIIVAFESNKENEKLKEKIEKIIFDINNQEEQKSNLFI